MVGEKRTVALDVGTPHIYFFFLRLVDVCTKRFCIIDDNT